MNLVILGAPGSGKGTQAKLLADHFGLTHISSGALLREESQKDTPQGKIIKQILDSGDLVSFDLVLQSIQSKLNPDTGFVLDGTPRDLEQARQLELLLTKRGIVIDKVIFLELSDDISLERLLKRAKTEGRSDDNEATINERLQVYHQQTEPLIQYYKNQNKLLSIDGRPDIDTIFQDILKHIG